MGQPVFSIIGCQHGHIASVIENMLGMGYRCAGIYEEAGEDRRLANALSGRFGVPLLDAVDEALAQDVSVVGCSAVNSRKIDVVELCEARGKPVMLDKPAVTNRAGLERLRGIVGRGRIEVGMLLTQRFHAGVHTLKALIDQGALGRVVSLDMRKPHRLNAGDRPAWFFDHERSGGIIQDLLVHDLDLLRWLTGSEIADLQGYMAKRILPEHPSFYDAAALNVRLADGTFAQLYADWHTPARSWTWGDGRIFAVGTEGTAELRLQGDPGGTREPVLHMSNGMEALHAVPLIRPPVGIYADFANRLRGGASVLSGADVLLASEAAVAADEKAERIVST
ncbi:Gfo/Idh/MocA family protein [Cohnella sp. JJ-181]|uniref:Gfo/Idh/MocA family protein n=1 Tax=Cohnella rhizoplanae TaxID=2974897 RepID=UPI0022FF8995|nr:Gfo/Idh/MocA family oxidoreductase [Cohnella sp. JJ-181]CAI6080183.1 Inositol 2-dehydrogenase/D-chiro-inositol 3-dehydrogenase [Cohnella sp. JJ-181]